MVAKVRETEVTTAYGQSKLMEGDPYLLYRIVGFHEYTQAIRKLSAFVRMAYPEELEAADQIVRASPEYTIYPLVGGTPKPDEAENAAGNDSYPDRPKSREQGLARVMAFARVELAAMLAGFSHHVSPFEAVEPMEYDIEHYLEFVLEGARWHYESLQQDPQVRTVAERFPPDEMTLAYIRRLNIARHFALAASNMLAAARMRGLQMLAEQQHDNRQPDPIQLDKIPGLADIEAWLVRRQELESVFATYSGLVNKYLNMVSTSTVQRTREYDRILQSCMDGLCSPIQKAEGTETSQVGSVLAPK